MNTKKDKFKIAFCGLYDDDNLGDPIIAHCTEQLYLNLLGPENCEVCHYSINYYNFHPLSRRMLNWVRIKKLLGFKEQQFTSCLLTADYIRKFKRDLKGCAVSIIVGGGLIEFTGGRFADGMLAIAKSGDKWNFPVIINATGVEGYNDCHPKCQELKTMLRHKSIKYVSTRDDLETIEQKYYDGKPTAICEKVADPAVWASEIYGIERYKYSNIIGIGIIRKNIFEDYGINVSQESLRLLYQETINCLLKKGHEVVIFTNGSKQDNDFAEEIFGSINTKNNEARLLIPDKPEELIEIIASCKGIIAGRLHSCIIAYSLDVPAVGLVWNEKLLFFGRNIGREENFILPDDFEVSKLVMRLESAIINGYGKKIRDRFRATIKDSIKRVCEEIIIPRYEVRTSD